MDARLLAALALSLAAVVPAGPASAAAGPAGDRCAATVVTPRLDAAAAAGVVSGGPIDAAGTLTCALQENGPYHRDADTFALSATGAGDVTIAPTAVTWDDDAYGTTWLCTQFMPAGGAPLYWSWLDEAWSSDAGSLCEPLFDVVHYDCWDICDPIPWWPPLDPTLCPAWSILAPGAPPAVEITTWGDVYVDGERLWDCPPYGD